MNNFKKNIFKTRSEDGVTPPPIITNSNISFSSPTVYQANAGKPYPDGGGTYRWEVGQCSVVLNVAGSNLVSGDVLTVRFQSFSTFATKQCCNVTYSGNPSGVNPSSVQIIPIMGVVETNITYNGVDNLINAYLYTPTGALQPTSSARSSMTLVKINGNYVTFPSSTDSASLVTPSNGSVTLTLS